jgi:CubicO group peptidase (beta-lactamase class C family)
LLICGQKILREQERCSQLPKLGEKKMKPNCRLPGFRIQLIFLVLTLGLPLAGQPPAGQLREKLSGIFSEWMRPGSPGGVVGIVKSGELVLSQAYGLASLEYEVPATVDTRFNVASVSKQFTAFSIVLLEQQGKLAIDDDVRKYLPELPDFGATITIRHLLNHTSGLRNFQSLLQLAGWRDGDAMNGADLLEYIALQRELNFPPGSEYLYCNTGYNLMAEIVERVSGQPFIEWTRENIFEPLGMEHSAFQDDVEVIQKNTATSYNGSYGRFTTPKRFWTYVGNGNLYTTVGDLARWVDNFRTGRLGGPGAIERMTERGVLTNGDTIPYALGVVVSDYRGLPRIQHTGSIGGYRACLSYFPKQETGIIVLSNFSSGNPAGKAMEVAETYLGEIFPEPKPETGRVIPVGRKAVTIDPAGFDAFAGTYWLPIHGGTLVRFFREGGRFLADIADRSVHELFPASDSSFFVKEEQLALVFHRENGGPAGRLTLYDPWPHAGTRIDPAMLDAGRLSQFEGVYYSPELKTAYTVVLEGSQLTVKHRRHPDFGLTPRSEDRFSAGAGFFRDVRFDRNREGAVTGLRVSNGRVRNLWMEKQ